MCYNIEYDFGEMVFLVTDCDQEERMVTAINLRPSNTVTYGLSFSTTESFHYAIEISRDRNILKTTTN